jgi:chromate transporter
MPRRPSDDSLLDRPGPASPAALFWAFTKLALQGFGGVLPVAQRELVERLRWLSREQFLDMLSMAQVLPGPNVVNLALIIGDRFFGTRGAAAAVLGIIGAPLVLVVFLAALAAQGQHLAWLAAALRGMGVVAAGLILATAMKLALGLRNNAMGQALCAALVLTTVVMVGVLRWPLVAVVLGLGLVAMGLAWHALRQRARAAATPTNTDPPGPQP